MKTTLIMLLCTAGTIGAQVQPDGGRSDAPWRPGSAVDIAWRNTIEANALDVELWDAGRQIGIALARRVPARNETLGILLPDTIAPGDHYVVVLRDTDRPWRRMSSTGFVPIVPAMQHARTTTVGQTEANNAILVIAPNPTSASALVSWDRDGIRKVRITGADGVARLDRDVESTERRVVLPSDRWASGTYIVELIAADGTAARSLFVVVH